MTSGQVGTALIGLALLLLAGKLVRLHWRAGQNLFLPASILGGAIGLALGPDILGGLAALIVGGDHALADGLIPADVLGVWSSLPGLMINVVFATLLLGVPLPRWRRVWHLAGPQLAFGLSLASGQYVLGILLAVAVLVPVFGLPVMAGALIEIGFEGGHGTAAGLQPVFAELGFSDGADLAVGMATVGVVGGMALGIVLVNWGIRRGHTEVHDSSVAGMPLAQRRGLVDAHERPRYAGEMTVRPESIEPLTLHAGLAGLAILIGYGLLSLLRWIESVTWGGPDGVALLGAVPLFPLAMIGGVLVQIGLNRTGYGDLLDRGTTLRLQGLALDVLIAAAIASLSLSVIAANLGPFLLLAGVGLAWNVGMFLWVAPRMIPRYWFERGIGDLGQSMGVTATGLILMKIADPDGRSPAYEAFGYKQLVFEPFFGGGLITGLALPVIYHFGPWPLFAVMVVLLAASLVLGIGYFGRRNVDAD